jgi:hypothetical protein
MQRVLLHFTPRALCASNMANDRCAGCLRRHQTVRGTRRTKQSRSCVRNVVAGQRNEHLDTCLDDSGWDSGVYRLDLGVVAGGWVVRV